VVVRRNYALLTFGGFGCLEMDETSGGQLPFGRCGWVIMQGLKIAR